MNRVYLRARILSNHRTESYGLYLESTCTAKSTLSAFSSIKDLSIHFDKANLRDAFEQQLTNSFTFFDDK